MKISHGFFWTLILATVMAQFGSSNVLPSRIQVDPDEGLLTDSGEGVGTKNGTDIIIAQPGTLDVIPENGELVFGVSEQQCNGEFLACYEADPLGQDVLGLCESKCGFYVAGRGNRITYMKLFEGSYKGRTKSEYFEVAMLDESMHARQLKTCSPKIENGMVHLQIQNASLECPVNIKNATIKTEPSTPPSTTLGSTVGPNTVPGAQAAATTESSSSVGDYWYLFLIFGLLIAAIVIATLVICFIKRRKSSKKAAAVPPRKLRGSQSPIVARPSAEVQQSHEAAAPPSYLSQSSIFSHKSMLLSKKEQKQEQEKVAAAAEIKEPEETDLTSVKPTA